MAEALAGKIAIVTGGANGIGCASVEAFAEAGAKVVIADVDLIRGPRLAAKLGAQATFFATDVANSTQVEALVAHAIARFGRLDVMFNNAGIAGKAHSRFLDDDLSDFRRVTDINLLGIMLGCRFAGAWMAAHGGGSIINTASIGGSFPGFGIMTYRATKAAILQLTKCLAIDLAEYHIRVNSISPGHIPTGMTSLTATANSAITDLELAMTAAQSDNQPLKRVGAPADVAEAALFLASDRARYVTGIDIAVDGGTSIGDPVNRLALMLAARERLLAPKDA